MRRPTTVSWLLFSRANPAVHCVTVPTCGLYRCPRGGPLMLAARALSRWTGCRCGSGNDGAGCATLSARAGNSAPQLSGNVSMSATCAITGRRGHCGHCELSVATFRPKCPWLGSHMTVGSRACMGCTGRWVGSSACMDARDGSATSTRARSTTKQLSSTHWLGSHSRRR